VYRPAVRRIVLVSAAGLVLAACVGGSEENAVRDAASEWLTAVYDSDGARACELLTLEATEAVSSCEIAYSSLGEALGESLGSAGVTREAVADGGVLAVEVRGDQATVRIQGTGKSLVLSRTPDGWRISRGLR
jgi:hypothetical protein